MFNYLSENVNALTKYSRYYLGISFVIFLLVGSSEIESLIQRMIFSFFILFGYILFYNFIGFMTKTQKKVNKHNWEKVKPMIKFFLNFSVIFFSIGIIMFLINGLIKFEIFTMSLLAINIPLGIILGCIKANNRYLLD